MGCDWVDSGDVYLGYSLSFSNAFRKTRFQGLEYLSCEDCYDEGSSADSDGMCKGPNERETNNPYEAIRSAWTAFLTNRHPELLSYNIQTAIGCHSKPCTYESLSYTSNCTVVFGYSMSDITSVVKDDVVAFDIPFTFPVGMPSIIAEFVLAFTRQESSKDKPLNVQGPEVFSFVN